MEKEEILELLNSWHVVNQQNTKKAVESSYQRELNQGIAKGISGCIADVIIFCSEREIQITEEEIINYKSE